MQWTPEDLALRDICAFLKGVNPNNKALALACDTIAERILKHRESLADVTKDAALSGVCTQIAQHVKMAQRFGGG